ncbi:MAG: murein hydrolase activator EnvC [Syntrophobacteraceae bacterium]
MSRNARWALLAGGLALVWAVAWVSFGLARNGVISDGTTGETSLQQKAERLQDECRGLLRKLAEGEAEHAALGRRLQARLTALYKFRALGYASALFPVHDMASFMEAGHLMEQIGNADQTLMLRWREGLLMRHHFAGLLARRQTELKTLNGRIVSGAGGSLPGGSDGETPSFPTPGTSMAQEKRDRGGTALLKKIPHRKPIFSESAERFSALRGSLPPPTVGEMVLTYGSKGDKKGEGFLHSDGVTFVAPRGQDVEAVFDGVVVFSDWLKDYGNVMIIDHGDHYHSLIAHAERLVKQVGDSVRGGEVVATVGSTGSSNTAQLYFEIRYHGKPVNPMEWLASGK